MRLCIVSDFFVPHYQGGGERRYYEILKRLVERGYDVDLICMKIKGVKNYENIDGIKVHHIGPVISAPPKRGIVDFIRFVCASFIWLLKKDYDIIECQGIGLLPASLAGKLKKAKSIAVIHDLSSGKSDQWLGFSKISEVVERFLIKLPIDRIINVSEGVKKRLVNEYGIQPKKIVVVNNGVDIGLIDSVKVSKKEENSIIFVGRLIPHKHVNDLILAVKILKNDIPKIKLNVIGCGQELKALERLAKDLDLEKQVKFFGMVKDYKDVIKEIKKSGVLVLPSTREGFGIVLAEAFACNVPCVAYYSDGVVEIIENNKNGFLVKQRDVEGLAARIKELLLDKKNAKEFARRGREKTERDFTWDRASENVESVHKKLVGKK